MPKTTVVAARANAPRGNGYKILYVSMPADLHTCVRGVADDLGITMTMVTQAIVGAAFGVRSPHHQTVTRAITRLRKAGTR